MKHSQFLKKARWSTLFLQCLFFTVAFSQNTSQVNAGIIDGHPGVDYAGKYL